MSVKYKARNNKADLCSIDQTRLRTFTTTIVNREKFSLFIDSKGFRAVKNVIRGWFRDSMKN
jgi:hypothetical protein